MFSAVLCSIWLKPEYRMADQVVINLEAMVPGSFNDWTIDKSVVPIQVDPEVQAKLDKIYSQVMARTYINSKGQRVMLSIAYGKDQSESSRAHFPTECYPAQGFLVQYARKESLIVDGHSMSVTYMFAEKPNRPEVVLYWLTVGNKTAHYSFPWKLEQLKYGLRGVVPDGMLFRVSVIGNDRDESRQILNEFVTSFADSIDDFSKEKFGFLSN